MTITIDTTCLVRFIVRDDVVQHRAAERALHRASLVAVTLPCLCELVWVLRSVYRFTHPDIAATLETLLEMKDVVLERRAVEAGLDALRAGRDFADGVIAHEGRRLGGATFVSFDKKAVALIKAQGFQAELL